MKKRQIQKLSLLLLLLLIFYGRSNALLSIKFELETVEVLGVSKDRIQQCFFLTILKAFGRELPNTYDIEPSCHVRTRMLLHRIII